MVNEAAVVGIWSSAEDTEIPRAFVTLKQMEAKSKFPDISTSISNFVSEKVSSYKRLRGGVVIIDALPRNTTGKLLKKVLKEYPEQSSRNDRENSAKL